MEDVPDGQKLVDFKSCSLIRKSHLFSKEKSSRLFCVEACRGVDSVFRLVINIDILDDGKLGNFLKLHTRASVGSCFSVTNLSRLEDGTIETYTTTELSCLTFGTKNDNLAAKAAEAAKEEPKNVETDRYEQLISYRSWLLS